MLRCAIGLHKWEQLEVCNTTVRSNDGSYFIVVFIHYECERCDKKYVKTTFESQESRKYFEALDKLEGNNLEEEDI